MTAGGAALGSLLMLGLWAGLLLREAVVALANRQATLPHGIDPN